MIDSKPNTHPCASSRFFPFVRTYLSSFTHFQHRTARVARYSIPLRYIPYRATLAFFLPTLNPNAGKDAEHSKSIVERYQENGIRAAHLDAETPKTRKNIHTQYLKELSKTESKQGQLMTIFKYQNT